MKPEDVTQGERSQSQEAAYCLSPTWPPYVYIQDRKFMRAEAGEWLPEAEGGDEEKLLNGDRVFPVG